MQYFVFHLVNPDEVFAGNATPNVKQMGPYSYRFVNDKCFLQARGAYFSVNTSNMSGMFIVL